MVTLPLLHFHSFNWKSIFNFAVDLQKYSLIFCTCLSAFGPQVIKIFNKHILLYSKKKNHLNITVMCAAKNKLTIFELSWHFIPPHLNIWASAEGRHLKLYLFLIWWSKLDCKSNHTWGICIIPLTEIHLHWIMTMTETNEWFLPPSLCSVCLVGNTHVLQICHRVFFLDLKPKFCLFSLPWSTVCSGSNQRYWYAVLVGIIGWGITIVATRRRKGWAQANDSHKVPRWGRLDSEYPFVLPRWYYIQFGAALGGEASPRFLMLVNLST